MKRGTTLYVFSNSVIHFSPPNPSLNRAANPLPPHKKIALPKKSQNHSFRTQIIPDYPRHFESMDPPPLSPPFQLFTYTYYPLAVYLQRCMSYERTCHTNQKKNNLKLPITRIKHLNCTVFSLSFHEFESGVRLCVEY